MTVIGQFGTEVKETGRGHAAGVFDYERDTKNYLPHAEGADEFPIRGLPMFFLLRSDMLRRSCHWKQRKSVLLLSTGEIE